MKKLVPILLCGSFMTVAVADIQSPPAAHHGPIRKLSRAIANLVYGSTEIPVSWRTTLDREGYSSAASYGIVKGVEKTVVRLGYGIYELVTFPAPTYKQGYRPPYYIESEIHPFLGYEEFPPQLGFIGEAEYNRTQTY